MLFCDRRETDAIPILSKLDVPITVVELPFGDYMWEGLGPGRSEVLVGVERKKLSDLVNSMKDRRLSGHQLRGLSVAVDFRLLLTEGQWRPGNDGSIEEWKYQPHTKKFGWATFYKSGALGDRSSVSYYQLLGYLTGLELRGNVIWRRTRDIHETAVQIVGLYKNFQDPWESHHSHEQVWCGAIPIKGHGGGWAVEHGHDETFTGRGRVTVMQGDPTTLWRMAAQLPGIDTRAEKVANHFGTVFDMAMAGLPDNDKERIREWLISHPREVERAWKAIDGVGPAISKAASQAVLMKGK